MIAIIKGEIDYIEEDTLVVDTGNIGYEVFVPGNVLSSFSVGMDIKLYTYMHVREDAQILFGFLTREDLDIFKKLITVNSVGPKSALSIMSTLTSESLVLAIISGDAKSIAKSPGVGAKSAQKIILELKDKFDNDNILSMVGGDSVINIGDGGNKNVSDAIETLVVLGYSHQIASKAVSKVTFSEDTDAGTIVSEALKHIN